MYGPALARVQLAGFADFARAAAPFAVERLRAAHRATPRAPTRVYDLGCGGGETTRALADAGFAPFGVDVSPDLLTHARSLTPGATFECRSLYTVRPQPCVGVLALGEPLTYHRPGDDASARLEGLFARLAAAIVPGGVLLFDLIDRRGPPLTASGHREGDDWYVAARTIDHGDRLERVIEAGVLSDGEWQVEHETHHVALFDADDIAARLARLGFSVGRPPSLGERPLLPRRVLFAATRNA